MSILTKPNRELIQREVVSKIHWGKEPEEVLSQLEKEHGIRGEEAETMLEFALAARAKEIRKKAMIWLVCSSLGLMSSIGYFWLEDMTGTYRIGKGSALFAALAIGSLTMLYHSIARLYTGEAPGPV
jgi:hypothetical protein